MKEPKIRFKEFKGEWEETTIGKVTTVKRGVRVTRKDLSNAGTFPVYQNTDYPMGYYDLFNVKANNPFVIIGGSAGLIGFSESDFWAADDCAYFEDNAKLNKTYLYALLLNKSGEIKKKVRGSSVPRLDRQVLTDLKVYLPHLQEQQSIASFFTILDAKISSTTSRLASLKQIKAASLQAMFPQEGETVPKLRFKGFEGEWEVCVLKDIVNKLSTGKLDANAMVREGKYRFYTCGKNYFRIDRYAFDDEALLISGNGENVGYVHYYKGKFNAYQRTYVLTHFEVNVFFLKYYLIEKLPFRIKKEKSVANTPYIKMDTISEMIVMYPSNEREQKQIGEYFQNLDRQITLQSQRLEKLKQVKAACLDNMFV